MSGAAAMMAAVNAKLREVVVSAVAESVQLPAEAVIARPENTVLFMSRRSELRLIKKARQPMYSAGGIKVNEVPGESVEFRDGVLRLPQEGKVRIAEGRMGDAADLLVWLETHVLHGDVEEGFWRVDPTAPPLSAEEAQAIARAARLLELEQLGGMLEAERSGWAREAVIAMLVETIEEVKGALIARDAEVEKLVQERLEQGTGQGADGKKG